MQITISSRHGNHLSEETQALIRDKASKLLHYFGRIMMIEITVDASETQKHVEFLVSAEHKHDFVANAHAKDLLAAVDAVMDKLEKQVRKYKEKITDHRHTPAMGDVTGASSAPGAPDDADER